MRPVQPTITVKALRSFKHGERSVEPGDELQINELDAVPMMLSRLVTSTSVSNRKVATGEYARRDMRAQDAVTEDMVAEVADAKATQQGHGHKPWKSGKR